MKIIKKPLGICFSPNDVLWWLLIRKIAC